MELLKEFGDMLQTLANKVTEEEMKTESDTELKSLYEQIKELQNKIEQYITTLTNNKTTFNKLMSLDIAITNIHQILSKKIESSKKNIFENLCEDDEKVENSEVEEEGAKDGE